MIGVLKDHVGLGACPRPADKGAPIESAGAGEDLDCIDALGVHGGDHDEVGGEEIGVRNLVEGVVEEADGPGGRAERGNGDHAEWWGHGGLGNEGEHAFEAPKGRRKTRPDHQDVEVGAERGKAAGAVVGDRGR